MACLCPWATGTTYTVPVSCQVRRPGRCAFSGIVDSVTGAIVTGVIVTGIIVNGARGPSSGCGEALRGNIGEREDVLSTDPRLDKNRYDSPC